MLSGRLPDDQRSHAMADNADRASPLMACIPTSPNSEVGNLGEAEVLVHPDHIISVAARLLNAAETRQPVAETG